MCTSKIGQHSNTENNIRLQVDRKTMNIKLFQVLLLLTANIPVWFSPAFSDISFIKKIKTWLMM